MKKKSILALLLAVCIVLCSACGTAGSEASISDSAAAAQGIGDMAVDSDAENSLAAPAVSAFPAPSTADPAPASTDLPAIPEESVQETQVPQEQPTDPIDVVQDDETPDAPRTAEEILAGLTLEEKVAQLFIICPEPLTGVSVATAAGDMTREAYDEIPVGGFIYMGQNLEDEDQTVQMLSDIQKISRDRMGLPVFTCIDEEGGTVARIGGNDAFDVPRIGDMRDIGDTGDMSQAEEAGREIGAYLSRLGFNLDFAPDADVLTNPDNEIVRRRSFGDDANLVSSMALAFAQGLRENNVIACAKHFPGHGATEGDTHEGYAFTSKTLDELRESELVPFRDWVNAGAGIVMVGHISLPNVLDDTTPSSLSYDMITGILREEYGYDGLIITDALNMGAITAQYSSAEASVRALESGVDLLLMPEDFHAAYDGVLSAVKEGRISESRLDESVLRIISAKLALG